MKHILATLVALCLAILPFGAHAGWCTGNVSYLAIDGAGNASVVMTWRTAFGYIQFCNMNADFKGVSPLTCATWFSLVKTAQQNKIAMYWEYASADVPPGPLNGPACTDMATEPNSPAPIKILITAP